MSSDRVIRRLAFVAGGSALASGRRADAVSYVMGNFSGQETKEVDRVVKAAAQAVDEWAEVGMEEVMNKYNGV